MTAIYIILGIVLFFALILSLPVGINIRYREELSLYLKILFVKIKIYPQDKKKKIKKSSKKDKKAQTRTSTELKEKKSEGGESLTSAIRLITEILATFFKAFAKRLHVRLAKIHIKVATSDAARTAILYGAVCGALACLTDLLNEITNLDGSPRYSITVCTDYLTERCEADIDISLSISVFGALTVLAKTLFKYIKLKFNTPIYKRKENENGKRKQI